MITLHELAHALASIALGNSPILYGNSVDPRTSSDHQGVITALAGPLASLVIGLVVLAVPEPRWPAAWRLTLLWFGLLNVQEFSGYLITGPFAGVGDIGQALSLTHAPVVVGWLGFALGWGITYVLGGFAVRRFSRFVRPDVGSRGGSSTVPGPNPGQLRAVGLYGWLLGAALTILVSLGIFTAGGGGDATDVAFEALGLLTSGIFLIFVRLFLHRAAPAADVAVVWPFPISVAAAALVVAVLRQLVLAHGVTM